MNIVYWCCQATHQQDSRWSWVVLLCATVSQMIYMGILRSFGVMFPTLMEEFQTSRERTAWIGSLALSLSLFAAPATGRLSEFFGCRTVMMTGVLSCMLGCIATSFIHNMEVMFLTFSTLVGLGACCCRTMCFLLTAKYFNKRRAFATGLVTMGPSFGMFIWGPTTQALLDAVGWRNAYRIMAAVCSLGILLALTFNPNIEEEDKIKENTECQDDKEQLQRGKRKSPKILDFSVWKIPQYCILVASFSLTFMCRFIPNVHLVKYSEELNIPAEKAAQFYMYLGICSAASRIITGRFGDLKCVNVQYINQLGIAIVGVATLLLPLANSYGLVALYTVVFGFADGAFITSQNVILLSIVGPEQRVAAFGFGAMCSSLALACGPPLAGFIADKLGSYEFAFYAAGCTMLVAAAIQFLLHCFKTKEKQNLRELVAMREQTREEHTDPKEHLASLYVDSILTTDARTNASTLSLQFI